MRIRFLAFFVLSCASLSAQYAVGGPCSGAVYCGLAATDDGSQLYFSSVLQLLGSGENTYGKIFEYSGQLSLVQQAQEPTGSPGLPAGITQLIYPQLSGDGSVVVFTSYVTCAGDPSACIGFQVDNGDILQNGVVTPVEAIAPQIISGGTISVSGDGRYALLALGTGGIAVGPSPTWLIDIVSRQATELTGYGPLAGYSDPDVRQAFTDGGSILLAGDGTSPAGVVLWNATAPQALNLSHGPLLARVSRNGAKVVYEWADASQGALVAYDVASGTETTLATPARRYEHQPGTDFRADDYQRWPDGAVPQLRRGIPHRNGWQPSAGNQRARWD